MSDSLTHTGEVWLWTSATSPGSWHFLTIDGAAGEAIAAHEAMRRLEFGSGRGFGSVKVRVRVGDSEWNTSVFPASDEGYILPLKAAIRKAEGIVQGSEVTVELELL
ncbi:DUF1905 domain-containing protein [Aurantiacibacter xanthus]|uniref:DUF1905 domain-containing protein n=1 Tax=Aurantiacibacter xanthus TaxID=1784712 RepID=A0A3A1P7Q8_9SPHN|nr:DUF1905 domain-containing protein [Aurantiacibacter xanthus]RIV84446.1 DUF1905 domain-containing protein [Aurantiacibacter xanthus]